MKKILLFAFAVVMLVFVSGVVVGKENKSVRPGGAAGSAKRSLRPKVRDQGARNSSSSMQARGREMMAARQGERMKADIDRATKAHKEFAAELEAIKKLADEEGAKKTSAKIQELIDKDKKKLEMKLADMKKRSDEFMKGMQGSPGGRGGQGRDPGAEGSGGQGRGSGVEGRGEYGRGSGTEGRGGGYRGGEGGGRQLREDLKDKVEKK